MLEIVAFGQIGVWQLVLVLVILMLLFGARRLPNLARSMGASLTEFKRGLRDADPRVRLPPGTPEDSEKDPQATSQDKEHAK